MLGWMRASIRALVGSHRCNLNEAPGLPHRFLDESVGPGLLLDQLRLGRRIVADGLAKNILHVLPVSCRVLAGTERVSGILQRVLDVLKFELRVGALLEDLRGFRRDDRQCSCLASTMALTTRATTGAFDWM